MTKPKILVVDDEQSNVDLLETYLSPDYDVVTAFNGKEALVKVEKTSPDLILLDIVMPGMSGFEVCSKLKSNEKTLFIPVLAVTALNEWKDRVKGIEAGADDFLSKPVDFNELSLRIKSLLRIKQYHDKLELAKQELLGAAEEKYRNLFDNANDAIVITDLEGRVTSWNYAAKKVFGWTFREAAGQNIQSLLVSPDMVDDYNQTIKKVLNGEVVPRWEIVCKRKDATTMDVSMTISPLKDMEYNINGVSVIFRDITERKWAWSALQQSELKYRDLFENANDAIFILDSNLNYKDVNKKAVEVSGYQRKELLKMNIFDIIPPEQHMMAKLEFQKLSKFGFYEKFNGKIIRKDGRIIDVEINSSAIKDNDKVIGSRDILRDITERKLNEEKIKASLEEKEVLLKEVHHRVKNNMQIISSLLRLQSGYITDEKNIEIFKESQNRILSMSLVHEKLYTSRDFTKIDIKDYITDLTNTLLYSGKSSGGHIALKLVVDDVFLGVNSAVPFGLMLNELVTNCIKHAFPDGTDGKITIGLHETGDGGIELIVSDNGVGIPEDIDFRKTESLGLHLVTILAEQQLRGEISMVRNGGTEFRIKFKG
jgi:PAS domain S-box-containing protein